MPGAGGKKRVREKKRWPNRKKLKQWVTPEILIQNHARLKDDLTLAYYTSPILISVIINHPVQNARKYSFIWLSGICLIFQGVSMLYIVLRKGLSIMGKNKKTTFLLGFKGKKFERGCVRAHSCRLNYFSLLWKIPQYLRLSFGTRINAKAWSLILFLQVLRLQEVCLLHVRLINLLNRSAM